MSTPYKTPLRDQKRAATRQQILEAVAALLIQEPDSELPFDAIAKYAGTSRRTVLNHFPDKRALLKAFWGWVNERLELHQWPESEADLVDLPPQTFAAFDRIEGIVRAVQSSQSGREMRLMVNPERQRAYLEAMAGFAETTDPETFRRAAAVVQVLATPHVWTALRDYWDMDGVEAGEAVSWAVSVLLDRLRPQQEEKD